MAEPTILIDKRGGATRLTLNRPDKLNSFDRQMRRELMVALEEAGRDESCRAVLLTGAGRGFCAGQDLADGVYNASGPQPDLGELLEKEYNLIVRLIRTLPKPVVAAVNGIAAGGGANLALSCDIVLAARSAKFLQAFIHIGLVPDVGGTWLLPRLVGDARARGLALLGEPLSAEQAENIGLIWRAVDDDKLKGEADALLARLSEMATQGMALTKRALLMASTNTLDQQLALERQLQKEAGQTPDYAEGVAAFLGKRKAKFSGRRQ